MANNTIINKNFNGDFEVLIKHKVTNGYEILTPIVEEGVKWETERQGSPGKLTFKMYKVKNNDVEYQEGDAVTLRYRDESQGWISLFNGFIFTKKRSKDGWIEVTAYDQLRYFKNKGTYVYTNKRASDVIKMIANDYKLNLGTIEDTNYVIGERVEDNQSMFDIVQNALDHTLVGSTTLYVLYDESGKLCLRDTNNMKLNYVINESVAKDFEYNSSIDDETYNEVELYYDNDETNEREYYRAFDATNIGNWGRLRYTDSIKNPTNVQDRVKKMLEVYNRKTRELKVKNAFGDYRCRAGASIIVQLNLGDVELNQYMLIEKATHIFKKDEYRMDLTLDDFNVEDNHNDITYSQSKLTYEVHIQAIGNTNNYAGSLVITYSDGNGKQATKTINKDTSNYVCLNVLGNSFVTVEVLKSPSQSFEIISASDEWSIDSNASTSSMVNYYGAMVNKDLKFRLRWRP